MAGITTNTGLNAVDTQPRGGRIGVSFDWGFAVALALGALGSLAGVQIGPAISQPIAIGYLVVAALAVVQGEALRRGNGVARRLQIGFHSLLVVGGIGLLLPTVQLIQQGRFEYFYSLFIQLPLLYIVSPIEIWLLLQPGSRRWYGIVDPKEASARHSGGWLVGTLVWAIVCGVLQAFAP